MHSFYFTSSFSYSPTRSPAHQPVLPLINPFSRSPTHPPVLPLTQSFSCSATRSRAHPTVFLLTHPFSRSPTHPFSCSSTRSLAHPPTRSPAHPPVLSLTHPLSRPPTRSPAHPLVPHKHAGSRERCVWLSSSWHSPAKCSVRQDGFKLNVVLRPQRPQGLLGTGRPGRPPRLSHGS